MGEGSKITQLSCKKPSDATDGEEGRNCNLSCKVRNYDRLRTKFPGAKFALITVKETKHKRKPLNTNSFKSSYIYPTAGWANCERAAAAGSGRKERLIFSKRERIRDLY